MHSAVLPWRVVCLSVCLSVTDVEVPWSLRLEYVENNFMAISPLCKPQRRVSTPKETPQILVVIGTGYRIRISAWLTNQRGAIYM